MHKHGRRGAKAARNENFPFPIIPVGKPIQSGASVKEERIHHPKHYNTSDIEHCEMVEAMGHADGYYFGQVTRYAFRQGQKPGSSYFQKVSARLEDYLDEGAVEDLAKLHWYASRWLAWRKHGKAIWKIVRRDPDIVFQPQILEREVAAS